MFRWRNLISVSLLIISISQVIGAEIQLVPSSPVRGEKLEFKLDDPAATITKWTVERQVQENLETVNTAPGSSASSQQITSLEAGEYDITAEFTLSGQTKKVRRHFVVQTAEAEQQSKNSNAADKQLESSRITKDSVSQYLKAKIPGDTDSPLTAMLMANTLKEIIKKNKDVTDENLIYDDLREGAKSVVDTRVKDILSAVYPGSTAPGFTPSIVEKKTIADLTARLNVWIEATEQLISRLKQTTRGANELLEVLNEAVLPALGAESVPLEQREPETPVPPLNTDTLIRILQSNGRGVTTVRSTSGRSRRCCIGILLGP